MHLSCFLTYRSYLLGQNIPLTTEELAARELKRQKAMELQEAIKQQAREILKLFCMKTLLRCNVLMTHHTLIVYHFYVFKKPLPNIFNKTYSVLMYESTFYM